ncbi:MAG: stage II sporulation protein R [Oscillospiraceae bacterium]
MSKKNIAIIIGLIVAIIVSPYSSFAKECEIIRDESLRLHIMANSDSDMDQRVKLLVRDEILKTDIFADINTKEQAINLANESKEQIKQIAKEVLRKNGFSYDVRVEVCEMFFETRYYENFTLPAGKYDAVRIILGEGNGKNWWCVLYPCICFSVCVEYNDEAKEIICNKDEYVIKFKSVEIYEKCKLFIENLLKKQ